MNEYKGQNATSSLEAGLVDKILYWDDLEEMLKTKLGVDTKKKLKYIGSGRIPRQDQNYRKRTIRYSYSRSICRRYCRLQY